MDFELMPLQMESNELMRGCLQLHDNDNCGAVAIGNVGHLVTYGQGIDCRGIGSSHLVYFSHSDGPLWARKGSIIHPSHSLPNIRKITLAAQGGEE